MRLKSLEKTTKFTRKKIRELQDKGDVEGLKIQHIKLQLMLDKGLARMDK